MGPWNPPCNLVLSDYLQPSNRCDDHPLLSWSWSVAVHHKPRIVVIVIVVAICGFSLLPPRPQAKAQRKQRQSRKKALLFVHLLKVLHNSPFSLQERATWKDLHPITKICAANCVSNYVWGNKTWISFLQELCKCKMLICRMRQSIIWGTGLTKLLQGWTPPYVLLLLIKF